MQSDEGIGERALSWILFAAMAVAVPVIYWLVVVGGFVPLLVIAIVTVRNLSLDMLLAINAAHLLVFGTIFYVMARWISKRLTRLEPRRRNRMAAAIVAAMAILGLAPIYGAGHASIDWINLYQLYAHYDRLR